MQTKTMNEGWACATGDSLLVTEDGFIRFDELYESKRKIKVARGGNGAIHRITDFHKEESVPTIRIRTRRGFQLEGAERHRVQLADGSWKQLLEVQAGERISLAYQTNIWPEEKLKLNFEPAQPHATLADVAESAGVSYATAFRHLHGRVQSRHASILDAAF